MGTGTGERALVLIVDDYEEGREICAEYLSFRGYRVATAVDGVEGLQKALELVPDVILMDLSLPGMDGWETTRRLRQDERTRQIPVIALTAHALASARTRALEAGCDEVVTKPVVPRDLEAVVRRQLDRITEREPS
jgi:two-component system, cell cycle response regulator DivK